MTEPTRIPRKQRRERAIALITNAAFDLANTTPDCDFTLRDVAEAAGLALGTVSAYFPARAELLRHMEDIHWSEARLAMDRLVPQPLLTVSAALPIVIKGYLDFLVSRRGTVRLFQRECDRSPAMRIHHRNQSEAFIANVIASARVASDWTPEVESRALAAIRILSSVARDHATNTVSDPATLQLGGDRIRTELVWIVKGLLGLDTTRRPDEAAPQVTPHQVSVA